MSKFWNVKLKDINPYTPGEQPQDKSYIKLNTNENPYPPSPNVIDAIKEVVNEDLKKYPDPQCLVLKEALAKHYSLDINEVFVGNGSDEILAFCFMAFFDNTNEILFPNISYSFYKVYANIFGVPFSECSLDKTFKINVDDYCKKSGGVIIANPNAPTGISISLENIEKILKANMDKVVIIDEAYIDFGGESSVGLTKKYQNLLVVQTFSKSRSLAGLRVGYAMGSEELIKGLEIVKNSFNSYTLDRIAIKGATEAVLDSEYYDTIISKIIKTREEYKAIFIKLGFNVLDSDSNFLFVSHDKFEGEDMYNFLKSKGVLVRHFKKREIDKFLRITIGTKEDMEELMKEINEFITIS